MAMSATLRKTALTAHVVFSVGWVGLMAAFLALAIAGVTSEDEGRVRGAYLAAEVTTWYVIVPLAVASLASGTLQSLGTPWGLARHYWVLIKLVLTVLATVVLLVHAGPISYLADEAPRSTFSAADFAGLRTQLVIQAGAALGVLLTTTALSIFKPRGLTRRGRRWAGW
jgi:hypothetical protein